LVPVKPANKPTGDNGGYIKNDDRKHYLINFFRMNYMWAVFSRAPWYICLCSVLVMLLDFFLRNGGKYFMRMFARHVLNKTGLIGQYFDMLTYSQASICCGSCVTYLLCLILRPDMNQIRPCSVKMWGLSHKFFDVSDFGVQKLAIN